MKRNKGIALTELLVVMSIMAILFAIGAMSLSSLERESHLDLVASEIKTSVYRAQSQTVNGIASGLYFENNRFVFFRGESFVEGDPGNWETALPASVQLTEINLFQGTLTFIKPTGYVNNYVSPAGVTLVETGTGKTRLITVNRLGLVQIN
ncbi:MAG: prepilin-type N-terminal cleavage/methylation domain-containing protein [Patescibacteria group bacterium]|nr:prepilin-type N-terminal cleavage/methylation domain-containing protein [Patescibacteria group bacterium]